MIHETVEKPKKNSYSSVLGHRPLNDCLPPTSSSTNLICSFHVKFTNDKDLNQCLNLLCDYFPINIYSPNDFNIRIETTQRTMFHSLFFNKTIDALALKQLTTMNISTDFIRQYLSTCIMDPISFIFVNRNEQYLKTNFNEKI
ncbi:unnamed protein product, partial [Rotaria sordida]